MHTFSIYKSPLTIFQKMTFFRILKLFKFELIKVIIFLVIFGALVYFVNSQSREYYGYNKKEIIR